MLAKLLLNDRRAVTLGSIQVRLRGEKGGDLLQQGERSGASVRGYGWNQKGLEEGGGGSNEWRGLAE